jgi:hypothetical protein
LWSNSVKIDEIDPVLYSEEEIAWLLENLGKPPAVAFRDALPKGVNVRQVRPLMEKLQELEQLKEHEGQNWIGFEEVKDALRAYQREDAKWLNDTKRRRNAPRFPSLYSYDSKGRPHLGGPGSDSGRVRTYFAADGSRVNFAKPLLLDWQPEWSAPVKGEETIEIGLVNNSEFNRWECFCGHTEQYKAGSRSSENAARARMSKHLRKATEEVDKHREVHTNIFGQASL